MNFTLTARRYYHYYTDHITTLQSNLMKIKILRRTFFILKANMLSLSFNSDLQSVPLSTFNIEFGTSAV